MDERSDLAGEPAAAVRHIEVSGSQGMIIGDNAHMEVHFHYAGSRQAESASGTVVAGAIPLPPAAFQPREDLMAALRASSRGISVMRAVTGMRGVGKTQLAAAYARECVDAHWRLVAWVNADDVASLLEGLALIASRLGIHGPGVDLATAAAAVRDRLAADGERCLVVFDNVEDPGILRTYLPAAGQAQIVITSTVAATANLGGSVPVDVFTDAQALTFLATRTGRDDTDDARALAAELGFLPLALGQAASVIDMQRLSYKVYLDRLRSYSVLEYLRPTSGEPYPRGTAEAIMLSFDAVTTADPGDLCGKLLCIISLLSPNGVSREVLYLGEGAGVFAAEPSAIDEALARLADASLLSYADDGAAVTAHRLVMRVLRERASHDGRLPEIGHQAIRLLDCWQQSIGETWRARPVAYDFARQVSALNSQFTPDPDEAVTVTKLLDLRNHALLRLRELEDSAVQGVEFGEQLVSDSERIRGPHHVGTVSARSNLSAVYHQAGRIGEAIGSCEQVVTDRERILGSGHPDTLVARSNLATLYAVAGRADEAILLHEQILIERERSLGPHHTNTATSRSNLALAYQQIGRLDEAARLCEQVVADFERIFGPDHPSTLTTRGNLANIYADTGRADEAFALHEQVLTRRENSLGPCHPDTLASRNHLAGAYQDAGRLSEAIEMFEETIAEQETVLGPDHPDTLSTRSNLATAYQQAGQLDKAIDLYEQALGGLKRVLGEDHPNTVIVQNNVDSAYRAWLAARKRRQGPTWKRLTPWLR
jgi:tetratricopeptide (TPR) repeat protein